MRHLGILAKYWQPGEVKTRLAATLGKEAAAQIYRSFLQTLLARFSRQADRHILCYTPPEREADFRAIAPEHWRCSPQSSGNLGQRMKNFFAEQFSSGADKVILIGSDSPNLPEAMLQATWQLLDAHEIVLGPSTDGGYFLIAARESVPPLFTDIPWSTPHVWKQSVEQLRRADVPWTALPSWYDVDNQADLEKLQDQLLLDGPGDPDLANLLSRIQEILRQR